MINSRFNDNTHCTLLYNSQVGAVIFMCSTAYKISSLPGIIADAMGSSTLWLYLMMSVLDLVCLFFVYLFFKDGTDEILTAKRDILYRVALVVLAAYLAFKGLVYFSYAVLYLTLELFTGVEPYIIIIVFLTPITYLGVKGMTAIARVSELTFFIVFVIIAINLVFIRTELDVGRNLPVLSVEPAEFFKQGFRYGVWLGDALPLLFVKVKNKRLPYIGLSAAATYGVVLVIALLGIAMYGNALPFVKNMLIRTAGFNQLSQEIGRMEWTALFAVVLMGIYTLSLIYFALAECADRVCGKRVVMQIFYPVALFVVGVAVSSLQKIADFSITAPVGYTTAALSVGLSVFFYVLKRKNYRRMLYDGGDYRKESPPAKESGSRSKGKKSTGGQERSEVEA